MSNDNLPVGMFQFDLPVWVLVDPRILGDEGLFPSIPSLVSREGTEYVPVFTDQDNADNAVASEPLTLYVPEKVDSPELLAEVVNTFRTNGVGYVGFDVSTRGRRYGIYPSGDVIDYIARRWPR